MVWPAPRIWSTHGETNDSNLSANTSHAADDRQLRQLHRLTHLAVPTGPVSFEERHPPDPLGEYLRAAQSTDAALRHQYETPLVDVLFKEDTCQEQGLFGIEWLGMTLASDLNIWIAGLFTGVYCVTGKLKQKYETCV